MDTKRALQVIILLLVAINLFMSIFIGRIFINRHSFQTQIERTEQILAYRDIIMQTDIPYFQGRINGFYYHEPVLNEEKVDFAKQRIDGEVELTANQELTLSTFVEPVEILDRFHVDGVFKELMDTIGFEYQEYVMDTVRMETSNTILLNYVFKRDGQYFYDAFVTVRMNQNGLFTCTLQQFTLKEQRETHQVLPATQILMSQLVRTDTQRMAVVSIDTGYVLNQENQTRHCWRIQFDDGTTRYFDSQTGREIAK